MINDDLVIKDESKGENEEIIKVIDIRAEKRKE